MRNKHPQNRETRLSRRRAIQLGGMGAASSLLRPSLTDAAEVPEDSPPPKYTLSCNMELMFPKTMPRSERLDIIADQGLKFYSFWNVDAEELKSIAKTAERLKLSCGSIAATPKVGWKTGLTKTGAEKDWLDEVTHSIEVAKSVGTQNLISFVGRRQEDIAWEIQHQQIISGLRKAGELAEKHDIFIVLEPLNRVEAAQMSVLTAEYGFQVIAEVDHPRVKLDFDIYHLQLSEGNLINHLRLGLKNNWIRFVEIGDVPGRLEPGTGEVNYPNIFKVLREAGYDGLIGLEHGTSQSPQHAIQTVKLVSGLK